MTQLTPDMRREAGLTVPPPASAKEKIGNDCFYNRCQINLHVNFDQKFDHDGSSFRSTTRRRPKRFTGNMPDQRFFPAVGGNRSSLSTCTMVGEGCGWQPHYASVRGCGATRTLTLGIATVGRVSDSVKGAVTLYDLYGERESQNERS